MGVRKLKKIEIVTYNYPKELYELATEMEINFSSFEVTDRRIDILQRASDHLYKLDEENKRLREALEFYAKEENNHHKNWFTVGEWEMLSKVTKDKGETARKALGGEGIDIPNEG